MFAILHGTLGHREVMLPIGCDIDDVDIFTLAKFFISLFARINDGRGHPGLAKDVLAVLSTCLFIVTKSDDLHTWNMTPTLYCTGATHTQTDKAHTNHTELRSHEIKHIFLTGRTFGHVCHNGMILPFPRPIKLRTCRLCDSRKEQRHCPYKNLIKFLHNSYFYDWYICSNTY